MKNFIQKLSLLFFAFVLLSSCEKLAYDPDPEAIDFQGVKEAVVSQDGSYIITWDKPKSTSVDVASYEIYIADMKNNDPDAEVETDENIIPAKLNLADESIGQETSGSDGEGMVVTLSNDYEFSVVASVKNQTSYKISGLLPGNYGIKVVALDSSGRSDGNANVLLLTVKKVEAFTGLVSAKAIGSEIIFKWNEYKSDITNGFPIVYVLYEGDVDNSYVFNEGIAIIKDSTKTEFRLSTDSKIAGSVWNYGLRVRNPLGKYDNNIKVIPVTIPADNTEYEGCKSGVIQGSSKIKINFEFLPDGEKVNVYRNSILAFTGFAGQEAVFTDAGLIEGETYEYKCESIKKGVSKFGSNVLNLTTLSSNPPTFSGITGVTSTSATTVTANWGVATGVPVHQFYVYATPGLAVDWGDEKVTKVEPSQLTVDLDELGDDLQYTFGVRACSGNGNCDTNTVVVSVSNGDAGAPLSPGASGARMDNGDLIIEAPWEHKFGGVTKRYVYLYDGPGAGDDFSNYVAAPKVFLVADPNDVETELTIPSVAENTDYKIIVRDQDIHGNTSTNVNFTIINTGDLSAPPFPGITSLNLGDPGKKETELKAGFKAIASTGADPSGASYYQIYLKVGGGDACTSGTFLEEFSALPYADGTDYVYTIADLQPRTLYSVCIKARDNGGNISDTDGYLVKSTIDETPPVFDGIQTMSYDLESALMNIGWNPSSTPDILSYQVKVWKNVALPLDSQVLIMTRDHASYGSGFDLDKNSFSFGSNDTVYIVVNACDNAAFIPGGAQNCTNFPYASAMNVTLADIDPPPGFAGVAADTGLLTPDETTVSVGWIAPADWTDYSGFKLYTVNDLDELEFQKLCACASDGCPAHPTSCDITGLDSFRTYRFHVRAYDAVGNLTILDIVDRTTPKRTIDETAPTFSSNLTLDLVDGTSTLEWTAATDNQYSLEPGAEVTYKVFRKDGSLFGNLLDPGADATETYETLDLLYPDSKNYASGQTYYYTVCAYDASDNPSCDGNSQSVTTPDLIPPEILTFETDKTTEDKLWGLTWTMSDNKPGALLVKIRVTNTEEADGPVDESSPAILTAYDQLSVAGLTGPQDLDRWVNYMLTIEDAAGNKTSKELRLYSTNFIEVTDIKSTEGPISGGKLLLLTGTGFHASTTIDIGPNACNNVSYISNTKIMCTSPVGTEGLEGIDVENSDGSTNTLSDAYSYCSGVGCVSICNRSPDWDANYADGDGTSGAPYVICNDVHLNQMRNEPNYQYFSVEDNINLAAWINNSFLPMSSGGNAYYFYGYFEGNGFVVANFHYEAPPGKDYVGLFGAWMQTDFKNFGIVNSSVKGNNYVGMLAGRTWACSTCSHENLFTTGTVEGKSYVGGVVGYAQSKFINVFSSADVDGLRYVGGLAGYKNYATAGVSTSGNVTAEGLLNTSGCYVGGIFGYYSGVTQELSDAHATGDVSCIRDANDNNADLYYAGGLFGAISSNVALKDCYYTGTVDAYRNVGGIAGSAGGKVTNCYTTGEIKGTGNYIGGLFGNYSNSIPADAAMVDSYSTATVTGGSYTGGLVGYSGGSEITDSYFSGDVTGVSYIGGITGYVEYTRDNTLTRTYSTAAVSGKNRVGGIAGYVRGRLSLHDVYSTGDVTGTHSEIGGIVGYCDHIGLKFVENTYATGNVSGAYYVGGFLGYCYINSTDYRIENSYATGAVDGDYYVGGFAGRLVGSNGDDYYSISNSYATGTVTATGDSVGGFVGRIDSNISIKRSYATGDATGRNYVGGFAGNLYYYNIQIHESYATGNVDANTYGGGFMGYFPYSREFNDVSDCYAHGNVVGNDYVAGFSAYIVDRVQRVYATGRVETKVDGIGVTGGIAAYYRTESYPGALGGIPAAYWDKNTTDQSSSASNHGSGMPTNSMKLQSTYTGFDFGSTWILPANNYPKLQWQP